MDEKDLKALLAYLAENTPRYPLEALRGQIIKAGHAPEDAERAIAVFQGRLRPPDGPAWPYILLVALLDLGLSWGWIALIRSLGAGRVSCAGAMLLPIVYLGEVFWGLAAMAQGKDRLARALLLGLILFLILGLLILSAFAGRWISSHSS